MMLLGPIVFKLLPQLNVGSCFSACFLTFLFVICCFKWL